MVNNNIQRLKDELRQELQELIKNQKEISKEVEESAYDLLTVGNLVEKNAELKLKIQKLEQAKNKLRKTLLAELAEGVHETYQNLIAEKETEIEIMKAEKNTFASVVVKQAKEIEDLKKLNNHKKIVSEIIKEYYEPNEDTSNWHEKLVEDIENGKKSDAIIDIIRYWKSEAEKWEEEAMIHLDAIGVSELWNKRIKKELRDEIDNGLELIEEGDEVIKSQQEQITKLSEFYLANKPLPKTPSKFKNFKEKAKTKFQQFKQLIKRQRKQEQKPELVARIEVKSN